MGKYYWSTLVLEFEYSPLGEPIVSVSIFVYNGPFEGADIEVNVLLWIYDNQVIESLESSLVSFWVIQL